MRSARARRVPSALRVPSDMPVPLRWVLLRSVPELLPLIPGVVLEPFDIEPVPVPVVAEPEPLPLGIVLLREGSVLLLPCVVAPRSAGIVWLFGVLVDGPEGVVAPEGEAPEVCAMAAAPARLMQAAATVARR